MRWIACLAAASCASSPPVARHDVPRCDPAWWRTAAAVRDRVRIGDESLALIDVAGDRVRVARIANGAIVARWEPHAALGYVSIACTPVASQPGARGDPALVIEPGFPLPAMRTSWLPIGDEPGIELAGFVPAAVRGSIWQVEPPARGIAIRDRFVIRVEPRSDAPVRAAISTPATVGEVVALEGWFHITAHTEHALVEGYVQALPAHRESEPSNELDVEAEPPPGGPFGPNTCLYATPNGEPIGMLLDETPHTASPAGIGWSRIELAGATYVTDAPIPPPPPPEPAYDWSGRW